MDVISFNSLWLYNFKTNLQKNYTKMFNPNNKEYNDLWQMYVNNYWRAYNIGLNIPDEMEYPLYFDYILKDTGYKNHTQFCKENYKKFCSMMKDTIDKINMFIREKESE